MIIEMKAVIWFLLINPHLNSWILQDTHTHTHFIATLISDVWLSHQRHPCIICVSHSAILWSLLSITLCHWQAPLFIYLWLMLQKQTAITVSAIQPVKLSLTQHLAHNDDVREGQGSITTAAGCLLFSQSGSAGDEVLDPLWWCCWWLPAGSDVTDVGRRPLLLSLGRDSLLLHEYCFLECKKLIYFF